MKTPASTTPEPVSAGATVFVALNWIQELRKEFNAWGHQ